MKLDANEVYCTGERKFLVAYSVKYKTYNNNNKVTIPVFTDNAEKAQKKARQIVSQFTNIKSALLLYVEDLVNEEIIY